MRWFKHFCNAHESEDLSEFIEKFGAEGYGVFWLIMEKIASLMNHTDKCSATYTVQKWCRSLTVRQQKLNLYLTCLQQKGIFSLTKVENLLTIKCAKLLKYRDEWTERQAKNSGVTRELLGSYSRVTPDQEAEVEANTETDTETEAEVNAGTSAPASTAAAANYQNVKNYFLEQFPAFFPDINITLSFWAGKKPRGMLSAWAKEGVTLEDVIAAVEEKRQKGGAPDNPCYYGQSAIDFSRERKKFGAYKARGSPKGYVHDEGLEDRVQEIVRRRDEEAKKWQQKV